MADPADTFLLAVDSRDKPGFLTITTVTVRQEVVRAGNPAFGQRSFRVDLVDHPLYQHIVAYVRNNGGRHG